MFTTEGVWSVLSDGRRYADWVVGTKRVRTVRRPLASHRVKVSTFRCIRPLVPCTMRRLCSNALLASAWFLRLAFDRLVEHGVEVRMQPSKMGSVVELIEEPSSPAIAQMTSPLWEPLLHLRNAEALRRLESTACRAA